MRLSQTSCGRSCCVIINLIGGRSRDNREERDKVVASCVEPYRDPRQRGHFPAWRHGLLTIAKPGFEPVQLPAQPSGLEIRKRNNAGAAERGVANAKAEGKYRGRVPTARAKSEEVISKFKAHHRPTDIAKAVGIGRASVYRILKNASRSAAQVTSRNQLDLEKSPVYRILSGAGLIRQPRHLDVDDSVSLVGRHLCANDFESEIIC